MLDEQNITTEVDVQGKTTEYIRGINLIASIQGTDIKFYLYNGHGDVVALTDATGKVTKEYDYDAFGNDKIKTHHNASDFEWLNDRYVSYYAFIFEKKK